MSYKKTIIVGLTLFGFVVLVCVMTFYVSLGKCPTSGILCDNATLCIPKMQVCDSVRNCMDGSDELTELCGIFSGFTDEWFNGYKEGEKRYKSVKSKYKLKDDEINNFCALNDKEIPNGCHCFLVNMLDCSNSNFNRIPDSLPISLEKLLLYNNNINLSKNHNLERYEDLTLLDLKNNNISSIPEKFLDENPKLRKLFLSENKIEKLPENIFNNINNSFNWILLDDNHLRNFKLNIFENLQKLRILNLTKNYITMKNMHFPNLSSLIELYLDHNHVEYLDRDSFNELKELQFLSLRFNRIRHIRSITFEQLHNLRDLRLSGNPIHIFENKFLTKMTHLNALYLDDLRHVQINDGILSKLSNVTFLSLNGVSHHHIDFDAITNMPSLSSIVFNKFSYCSMIPNYHIKVCRPKTDGISSKTHLLSKPFLRHATWIISSLTCIGNLFVLWGRFTIRDENRSVSIVIRNLALSDTLMGIYLAIIAIQDFLTRDNYGKISREWISSWTCSFIGALSMTSSEVSLFILTFICVERFLLISDPFNHRPLNTQKIGLILFIIWIIGIFIAIFPIIFFHNSSKYYGLHNDGMCFPFFVNEKYETGWEFSAIIFFGINFILLLLIATLYSALLYSIWRTRRATTLNFLDCEFAIRFFFIVLTDSLCWAPIIIYKFLAFTTIDMSSDIYAWIVVFILPLNSAVNPFLYTFTTPRYRDQIYSLLFVTKNGFTRKQDSTSQHITADESQVKIGPFSKRSI